MSDKFGNLISGAMSSQSKYQTDIHMRHQYFMALGATNAEIDRMQAFIEKLATYTIPGHSSFLLPMMDYHYLQVRNGAPMLPSDIRLWTAKFLEGGWQFVGGDSFIDLAERVWQETTP